jgi:hypothetical protein
MMLLKKPGALSLSLLFLFTLFATYSDACASASLIPAPVRHDQDTSRPAASAVVALLDAENNSSTLPNPLQLTRFTEKQAENAAPTGIALASPITRNPAFTAYNRDPVLNL